MYMKKLKDKLQVGLSKFFSLEPINIAIFICLFLIIILSFHTSRKIDLFGPEDTTTTPSITPSITISELEKQKNLFSSVDILQDFIAKLNGQVYNASKFQTILNQRQDMINNIQKQQNKLKSSTSDAIALLNIN